MPTAPRREDPSCVHRLKFARFFIEIHPLVLGRSPKWGGFGVREITMLIVFFHGIETYALWKKISAEKVEFISKTRLQADLWAYFQYVERDLDTAQLGGKESKRLRNCLFLFFRFLNFLILSIFLAGSILELEAHNMVCNCWVHLGLVLGLV